MNPDLSDLYKKIAQNQIAAARDLCISLICINPSNIQLKKILGTLEILKGNYSEGIKLFSGIDLMPHLTAEDHYNLGCAYSAQNNYQAAITSFTEAINRDKFMFSAYHNRANAYRSLHDINQALKDYAMTLSINPQHDSARLNQSIAFFLNGNLTKAWPLYESRFGTNEYKNYFKKNKDLKWVGQPIKDKHLYLYAEQGLGDSIQFIRYVRKLCEQSAKLTLQVQNELVDLFKFNFKDLNIISLEADVNFYDYQSTLPSLGYVFNTDLNTIPYSEGYLKADQVKVQDWRLRLGSKWQPRVGIVWSGNAKHSNDNNRSIRLDELLTYLPEGFDYISLQNDRRLLGDIANQRKIKFFDNLLVNFSETAALCECMDLIVSVDTSVAHLSGALGKKTSLLIPYNPDWRWMLQREDSPWYKSIKLYRQQKVGDWESALRKLSLEIRNIPRTF